MKKKVFLQFPEGLKTKAVEIAKDYENKGFEVIINGDPCYGACDIRFFKGYKTIQYGHSKMLDEKAEYVPWRLENDLVPVTLKALNQLPEKIGISSTIQHSHKLEDVVKTLEENNKKACITPKGNKCSEKGQVLGCDLSGPMKIKDEVNGFLFIGTGKFHPIGIAHYTSKPVVRADPLTSEVEQVNPEKWLKESALRQTKASNARKFGIVVSSKPGQKQLEKARELHKKFESVIIVMDEITPEKLLGYDVDAFIITACPRIVIDDWKNYDKIVLLPEETEQL